MNDILPQDPIALLKAVSSLLPPEAQEHVRQALAAREARHVNRGVHILSPDEGLDGIDPTNQSQVSEMHEHPGTLYPYGINTSSFGGLSADRSKFVVVAADLLTQHRRQILEVIFNDYLGDVPAISLAEEPADWELLRVLGIFVFAGNKLQPKPLGEKNLKRMVDYAEDNGNDPEMWTCEYWRIADWRARQVAHWLPRDESQP